MALAVGAPQHVVTRQLLRAVVLAQLLGAAQQALAALCGLLCRCQLPPQLRQLLRSPHLGLQVHRRARLLLLLPVLLNCSFSFLKRLETNRL